MPSARTQCPQCAGPLVVALDEVLYSAQADFFQSAQCGHLWHVAKGQEGPASQSLLGKAKLPLASWSSQSRRIVHAPASNLSASRCARGAALGIGFIASSGYMVMATMDHNDHCERVAEPDEAAVRVLAGGTTAAADQ